MGRFILLFLIVGAVVMFLLVLETPPQIIRDSYFYQKHVANGNPRNEPVDVPAPAAKPRAPRRATATTTRPVEVLTSSPVSGPQAIEPLSAPRIERNLTMRGVAPDMASISTDAALYSSNSPSAALLKVLNKGQVVEVDLEFITPGGRWALVTIPSEKISGFVRSDSLVLTSANAAPPPSDPVGAR